MMSILLRIIFLIFICRENYVIADCGDWQPYINEKCFKILDESGLQDYATADKLCRQEENGSSLILIRSKEEQEFVANYFKTQKVANDVWIGAKYTVDNSYKWTDNSDIAFANWAAGSPKNQSDHCVQFLTDESGKWSDVLCGRKNAVACQRIQIWSFAQLQEILLNAIKNPVPIGFVYVQLPNERAPQEIWPRLQWSDVSANYAGVFFRVDGGGSAAFGQTQEGNVPRFEIETINDPNRNRQYQDNITIPINNFSNWTMTGENTGSYQWRLTRYKMSAEELRPKNVAVRVWKREQ